MALKHLWQAGTRGTDQSAAPDPAPPAGPPPPAVERAGSGHALQLLRYFEQSGQGWLWSTDAGGRITYITDRIAALLEIDPAAGLLFSDLFVRDEADAGEQRTLSFLMNRQSRFERLSVRAAKAGLDNSWALAAEPVTDFAGQFAGFRGSAVDITEQRKSSAHASQLAMYDALTGLPNRVRMGEVLETSLTACKLQRRSCAVMLIDLDRFKQVNDTLGHPAGDALLQQVAKRLLRLVGDRESIFRLGGDEFQIIVRGQDDEERLGELAQEIISTLSQPYSVGGSRCVIGASVGIALAPRDGDTNDALIRNADLALYDAKESGRGAWRFFSTRLLEAAEDKRRLEEDLRDALACDQLDLHYQPIVRACDNNTTGVEALVRWTHPERGPISPALFIPIAEEANLIEQLGEWVLRRACRDAASWPGNIRVAVNVSPIQFTGDNLITLVRSALNQSKLAASRLELEITEGVFLHETNQNDAMFAALKDIGVRLALDDFGTGYSSLGYLKTAPFDKIKIDQSFVRAATLPGSRNRAIISAIVALGDALGMETTAEGVETLDQLDLIRQLGVSHVQGYVYSKPVDDATVRGHLGEGSWTVEPAGPTKQRADRHSMFRKVGAIIGNYYQSVLIRNLSESGALIEGLSEVPVGTLMLIDFGEGQLAFARVRRSNKRQQGVEFEQPLVRGEDGSFSTSSRISSYALRMAGLPRAGGAAPKEWDAGSEAELQALREKLGIEAPATRAEKPALQPAMSSMEGGGPAPGQNGPTVAEVATRYLATARAEGKDNALDRYFLAKHILPQFGGKKASALSIPEVSSWLVGKSKEKGFTAPRIDRMHMLMGHMMMAAMRWDQPVSPGGAMTPAGHSSVAVRKLTRDELERLESAARESGNLQLRNILMLLVHTGTRQRELLPAQWEEFDLDRGVWRIPAARTGQPRRIVLRPEAQVLLAELPRWDDCPWLLPNPATKKPYRSIFNSWDATRAKAGLQFIELDELRFSAVDSSATPKSRQFVQSFVAGGTPG